MIKTFSKKPENESSREVVCNICGSTTYKKYFKIPGAIFVKCRTCGLVFQNPQPFESDLVKRYDSEYFEYEIENEINFYNLARQGLKDICFANYRAEVESLGPFLDVGCATGYLLNKFCNAGWKVEGVEVCIESAGFASERGGFPVHTKPLEQLKLESGRYGAVHLSHVIEHLTDPSGFCREVFRILAPGGYFILTTPNISGFQSVLLGKRWRSVIPDHLYLFSDKTLTDMLKKTGFSLESMKTWGGLANGLVPRLVKQTVDRLAKRLGFGDVMILLVQKPPIS